MGNTLSLTFPLERVAACLFSSSWQFSASSLLAVSTALPEISPQASSLTDSSLLLAANPVDNSDKPSSLTLSPTPWVGHTSQAGRLPTWGRCTGGAIKLPCCPASSCVFTGKKFQCVEDLSEDYSE